MNSTNIGPRVGGAYLITSDARNVAARVLRSRPRAGQRPRSDHDLRPDLEPLPARHLRRQRRRHLRDRGRSRRRRRPRSTPSRSIRTCTSRSSTSTPWDLRKQFPGQISLDLSFNRRYFKDAYAEVDINGIYPSGPNQPFGGFGRVDPNRGMIMQQTNATWSKVVVTNLEAIIAKNLSHNFQVVGDADAAVAAPRRHVESHRSGALHPARRVREQPRSVAASVRQRRRQQPRRRRRRVGRGLPSVLGAVGRAVLRAVGHQGRGELRHSGWRLSRSGRGPERDRRSDLRPRPRSDSPTARRSRIRSRPSWRFAYGTRAMARCATRRRATCSSTWGATFKFGRQSVDAGLGIFNVFNTGAHTQWNTGANRLNNALYLSRFNRHPPRAFQITLGYKF